MINHEQLIAIGLGKAGASLQYPFDPNLPVLFVGSKMFALLGRTGTHESVNLKVVPEEAWLTRQQYPDAVLPGYHMNKKHWNTVVLNGTVPSDEVLDMLEQSYRLVRNKLTRSERDSLE
ncbi:MmcQ/YjbR family DNA-binding protein [Cohnella yongneupensis]|uniref:MmcQ/YjbR family DNA-binding protein n=1 Tax=Cohnella yongneupensis TaxID=425006 RepID=A0ABW0QXI9_9BACL